MTTATVGGIGHVETLEEAQTRFVSLVEAAHLGQITIICDAGCPVAMLSPYAPAFASRTRTPGGLSGEFWMADDFDETPSELVDAFENASV